MELLKRIAVVMAVLLLASPLASRADTAAATRIPVDAAVYRRHQVCLADVRGTAGRITGIHMVPALREGGDLEGLKVCLFWDGAQTPFVACSLAQFLHLFDDDGMPAHMPEMSFREGFRFFLECVSGKGGKVTGHITYILTNSRDSSKRVRFDPDLGITPPRLVDIEAIYPLTTQLGHGEAIMMPNSGFESGTISPWQDFSWEKGCFRVYPTGTEGVRAHTGEFMAGTVVPGKPTRGCKGVTRVGGLIPGYRYRLSAWVHTFNFDQQPQPKPVPWNAKVRLGLNTTGTFLSELYPEGGSLWTADFSHPRFYFAHCWGAVYFAHSQGQWSEISVEARAKSEVASVELWATQWYGHSGNRKWCLFDDVTLQNVPIPMGRIQGRVVDNDHNPLPGALVNTIPWSFRSQTAEDGTFQIEGLPEGVYELQAKQGRAHASISGLRVLADRSVTVELTLGDSATGNALHAEPAEQKNQLINADFESGDAAGWQRLYVSDAMDVGSTSDRVVPASGRFMFGGEHVYHHAGAREILYQRVPAEPGSRWTFSGRLLAHSADGGKEGARCRLVIDPVGSTEFPIRSHYHNGPWREVSVNFEAQGETVSVGVALEQQPPSTSGVPGDEGVVGLWKPKAFRSDYNAYYCDDLHLIPADADAEIIRPVPFPAPPDVKANASPDLPDADSATITLPDGKTRIELIRIPAGTFLMGADSRSGWARDDEYPRHTAKLDAYWIGKYEVTNAQYKAFCDDRGYPYPPDPAFSQVPWAHRERAYDYGDYFDRMPDHPVVNVTWYGAQAFCRWAGLRLPTEAEWEMAARGPGDSLRTYPWGEQTDPAWTTRTRDNTSIQQIPDWFLYTGPVGSFEAGDPWNVGKSAFGVCSLGGNAQEWCADWYGPYPAEEQDNPRGPSTGTQRVLRGGCWRWRDYGVITRCSYRDHHDPNYYKWGTTGFRVSATAR